MTKYAVREDAMYRVLKSIPNDGVQVYFVLPDVTVKRTKAMIVHIQAVHGRKRLDNFYFVDAANAERELRGIDPSRVFWHPRAHAAHPDVLVAMRA